MGRRRPCDDTTCRHRAMRMAWGHASPSQKVGGRSGGCVRATLHGRGEVKHRRGQCRVYKRGAACTGAACQRRASEGEHDSRWGGHRGAGGSTTGGAGAGEMGLGRGGMSRWADQEWCELPHRDTAGGAHSWATGTGAATSLARRNSLPRRDQEGPAGGVSTGCSSARAQPGRRRPTSASKPLVPDTPCHPLHCSQKAASAAPTCGCGPPARRPPARAAARRPAAGRWWRPATCGSQRAEGGSRTAQTQRSHSSHSQPAACTQLQCTRLPPGCRGARCRAPRRSKGSQVQLRGAARVGRNERVEQRAEVELEGLDQQVVAAGRPVGGGRGEAGEVGWQVAEAARPKARSS